MLQASKLLFAGLTLTCMGPVLAASGYIYDMSGNVSVATGSTAKSAHKNQEFDSGVTVHTGDKSHVVLKFEDGQIIALQSNTSFQVQEYRYSPKQPEQGSMLFSMLKGGLRFVTGLIGQSNKNAFKLNTPNATIGIRGTDAMVAMVNNSMYSQVTSGGIGITNSAGTSVFTAGQTAVTTSSVALPTSVSSAAVPAGTFGQLGAIPIPAPAAGATGAAGGGAAGTSGSAASGGAAATGGSVATAGVTTTSLAIGAGAAVAAGTAALGSNETTSHHGTATHH